MSLEVQGLSAKFNDQLLFQELSFEVGQGQVLAIMGPSGVGKSTLLNLIAGFEVRDLWFHGSIKLQGQSLAGVPPHKRGLGMVFQNALLFPHLNVGQNLSFGLPAEIKGDQRRQTIAEALESASLSGFENRDPEELSGGQKARVSLLRTLLSQPKALLLDEPFSALDDKLRAEVQAFTAEQIARFGLPTLMVTHDPQDAAALNAQTLHLHQE